jgi:hypothetical protein
MDARRSRAIVVQDGAIGFTDLPEGVQGTFSVSRQSVECQGDQMGKRRKVPVAIHCTNCVHDAFSLRREAVRMDDHRESRDRRQDET